MNVKQTVKELRWKANQLMAEAEKYHKVANELEELSGSLPSGSGPDFLPTLPEKIKRFPRKKRHISAAARARMSKGQKERWSNFRAKRKAEMRHVA